MGNGSHGQWSTWAMRSTGGMGYRGMGHMGNTAHGHKGNGYR